MIATPREFLLSGPYSGCIFSGSSVEKVNFGGFFLTIYSGFCRFLRFLNPFRVKIHTFAQILFDYEKGIVACHHIDDDVPIL